tara:strand:+ start:1695 stop:1877 length:183 start_codon:yes stop_codon:yes gene_type:complete
MNDKDIHIMFDGDFTTTLHDIITDNSQAGCVPITDDQANEIRNLPFGGSTYIGWIKLERI